MGGVHCAAWNAPFPTNIEVMLWRVSSVMISSTFIVLLLIYLCEPFNRKRLLRWVGTRTRLGLVLDRLDPSTPSHPHPHPPWSGWNYPRPLLRPSLPALKRVLFFAISALDNTVSYVVSEVFYSFVRAAVLLYVLARAFLVVECFINLGHLPDSAYDVPQWTQYLPSIS